MNELTDLNGINILKATYNFVMKNRRLDFFIDDLSYALKTNSDLIRGGIIDLWRDGFISFDLRVRVACSLLHTTSTRHTRSMRGRSNS